MAKTNYSDMPGKIGIRQPVPIDDQESYADYLTEHVEPGWMSDRGKVVELTTKLQKEHSRGNDHDGSDR